PVIPEHRVPDCRIHAYARCTPGKGQVLDSKPVQNVVQFCLIETAEPVLIEHPVLGFRPKLCDDIRVPCIADQKSSLPTVRSEAGLADTEMEMAYSVRRVNVPEVR